MNRLSQIILSNPCAKIGFMLLFVLGIPQGALAGKLGDFEKSASTQSPADSDEEDQESCFICDILVAILTGGDRSSSDEYPRQSNPDEPMPRRYRESSYSEHSSSHNTIEQRRGWELQQRFLYGQWDSNLRGGQYEIQYALNWWMVEFDWTLDQENEGLLDDENMSTRRLRTGVLIGGKSFWFHAILGFSVLEVEKTHGYLSSRLGLEYRRRYAGLRCQWDNDQYGSAGFHDFYSGGYLKRGPIQFDLGYRIRTTFDSNPVTIHGPQAGLTLRLGRWRYSRY